MTKSDYFLIAKAIKQTWPDELFPKSEQKDKARLIENLVAEMKLDNPNFQSFRFLLSCGAEDLHGKGL